MPNGRQTPKAEKGVSRILGGELQPQGRVDTDAEVVFRSVKGQKEDSSAGTSSAVRIAGVTLQRQET